MIFRSIPPRRVFPLLFQVLLLVSVFIIKQILAFVNTHPIKNFKFASFSFLNYNNFMSEVKEFFLKRITLILIAFAAIVFSIYLSYIFKPACWPYGYTLCAAIGEDFFALLQASYNFFHHFFIYQEPLSSQLITPYYMPFKYFPISSLLAGWPFILFFKDYYFAYQIYLGFSVTLHLASIGLIYLIAQKLRAKSILFILATVLWLTFFPLASEWRMGQFNNLAGIFFLLAISFSIYRRPALSAVAWILSLSWKPLGLFAFGYYWVKKNKLALWLFLLFFVLFTAIYLIYWQHLYPFAWQAFLKAILTLGDRSPLQIHYIDNFGVFAFWGELFYNWSPAFYGVFTKIYLVAILIIFFYLTLKKGPKNLYYLLFAGATIMMYHKEVWESMLTFWLPILVVLILMSKKKRGVDFHCNLLDNPRDAEFVFFLSSNPKSFMVEFNDRRKSPATDGALHLFGF